MKKLLKWIFTFLVYALGTFMIFGFIHWLLDTGKVL